MIRYDLQCLDCGAEFDAWFASSSAYDEQVERELVRCSCCDSSRIAKQIMAPAIRPGGKKSSPSSPDLAKTIEGIRDFIDKTHDYVGDEFADEARAMHYGEIEQRPIWGETTAEDRAELQDEGVDVAPLPAPFAPQKPDDTSKTH